MDLRDARLVVARAALVLALLELSATMLATLLRARARGILTQ